MREHAKRTGRRAARASSAAAAALVAVAALACDTNVTNPGPIQDSFLDDATAQAALVAGAERALGVAMNWIGYTSAAVAREIHPSGSTGSFGITIKQQRGELEEDEISAQWNRAHRARFLAIDGIRRVENLDPADRDQDLLAEAYLISGYAHRLLGESMCDGVIDLQQVPHTDYLDIAEAHFTQAAQLGLGDVATAAIAGRASVRVDLGDWSGAVDDAGQVGSGFSYIMPFWDTGDNVEANRIHVSTRNEPYKAHTQWNTWIETYGLSTSNPTGDPRVPYLVTDEDGDAAIECCGTVPWWPEQKHDVKESPMDLSTGSEMRLIEAENALRNDDLTTAMTLINDIRTAAGVNTVAAATVEEGWTYLKRERAIELWLEARRLPDLRRWNADGTPGDLQPLEQVSGDVYEGSHLLTRDYCYPISQSETETNPNLRPGG